jgi:hypothetical protein
MRYVLASDVSSDGSLPYFGDSNETRQRIAQAYSVSYRDRASLLQASALTTALLWPQSNISTQPLYLN